MPTILSACPKDFIQGGLLQDCDVEVIAARWEIYDYGGRVQLRAAAPIALHLTLKPDGDETTHDDYITNGASSDYIPNPEDDGDTAIANGAATQFRLGSNYDLFATSAMKQGFPESVLRTGKASAWVGLKAHIVRLASPKRKGLEKDATAGDFEKTYLAIDKIISLPGAKAPARATAKGGDKATGSAPHTAAEISDEIKGEVAGALLGIIGGLTPPQLPKPQITVQLLKPNVLAAPARAAAVKLAMDDNWLASIGLTVKDGVASLG